MPLRRRTRRSQKMEFSKQILILAGIINVAVIIFTFIMVWRTLDLTPLAYLIPAVAGEVSAGTVSYYAKAKVENRILISSMAKEKKLTMALRQSIKLLQL